MKMKAKFSGICPLCCQTINVGQNIRWSAGLPAVHTGCQHTPENEKLLAAGLIGERGLLWALLADAKARPGIIS